MTNGQVGGAGIVNLRSPISLLTKKGVNKHWSLVAMSDLSRRSPAADFSVEVLIEFWDRQVRKLVEAGIPADRIANSLWVVGSHAETIHASDPKQKPTTTERMRDAAQLDHPDDETAVDQAGDEAGGRPERRGPGRPWSKP